MNLINRQRAKNLRYLAMKSADDRIMKRFIDCGADKNNEAYNNANFPLQRKNTPATERRFFQYSDRRKTVPSAVNGQIG
jgi:hypothetical protein